MTESSLIEAHIASTRPRALALLTRSFRHLDLAEDAYQEASLRALQHWRKKGLPRNPSAWLIQVARNVATDWWRHGQARKTLPLEEDGFRSVVCPEPDLLEDMVRADYRDDILRLLFMCCHDELSTQDQLALALKIIVGLPVAQIARAFVIQPKAMEQRITRAKKKASILATCIDTPSPQERAKRLDSVATMIYLMFNEGYAASTGDTHIRIALCEEAIRLARLLLELFPGQPDILGLLALCLCHHARQPARVSPTGALIALSDQDRNLWRHELIAEGLILIEKALRKGRPCSFQLQAAIAAVHCRAETAAATDWAEIERLYVLLEALQPSPVITLNRAIVLSKTQGAKEALALAEPLAQALSRYLPYHTTMAALFKECARWADAAAAYQDALSLNPNKAERTYIEDQLNHLRS